MSSAYDTKSVLLDLMKEGENKLCADCDVPMPQWASLSYGIFVCLSCSGVHRSLGVHISFVRSITMDKWTEVQIKKMQTGGNQKWREFCDSSPDYTKGMSIVDKYNSHFAAQYKDKLLAEVEGRSWDPSHTPAPAPVASTLRKPRSLNNSRGPSPAPRTQQLAAGSNSGRSSPLSPGSIGGAGNPYNQKARNEDYFASMGAANDNRPEDLPPSQGGKYGGFGSEGSSIPDSNALSSRALPSLDDLRDDPVSALGRGWGFLGAALGAASKTINESVVQPTLERVADPNLQSQVSSYVTKAGSVLGEASRKGGEVLAQGLQSGSTVIRRDLGYDVGDLGANYVEHLTGRGAGQGYAQVGTGYSVPSAESQEAGTGGEDFFDSQLGNTSPADNNRHGSGNASQYNQPYNAARSGYSASKYDSASDGTSHSALAMGGYTDEQEDGWAKLAPQARSKLGSSATPPGRLSPVVGGTSGGAASRGAISGRRSPAATKPAIKKDDWDDFAGWKDD